MLTLNIIPNNLKDEIKLEKNYKLILKILCLILIVLIVYATSLLISSYFLENKLAQTLTELITASQANNYTKKFDELNKEIEDLYEIQNQEIYWSYFLEYLAGSVGNDIKFTNININKKNNKLTLTGTAKSRESLLKFKESLEKSPYLTKVEFPIKNLLAKNDINFNIEAEIKSYNFN